MNTGISDETFSNKQLQQELLAFALTQFEQNGNDYEKVKQALLEIPEQALSNEQADIMIAHLKRFNNLRKVSELWEGQIWKYKTRSGEEDSRFTIFKIETINQEEVIIHISVNKLKISNPGGDPAVVTFIGHLPISKAAFIQSATELERQLEYAPEVPEGYFHWKDEHEKGKAGLFDISVSGIIDFIESTLEKKS